MRVLFCWAEVTGYMAACWQALARRPGVDVHILHTKKLFAKPSPFNLDPLLAGLSNTEFSKDTADVDRWLLQEVDRFKPDAIVLCGWIFWPYTKLMYAKTLEKTVMVLGMDSPWRGTPQQRLARLRLWRIASNADLVVTASAQSAEYAQRLGVPERKIRSGYYGFDYDRFSPVAERRASGNGSWPRQFLFVGRYVPQKDLGTLVAAYTEYRRGVSNPWGLTCCGTGDDAVLLKGVAGVVDAGFSQPEEQPEIFRKHGAFVLSSKFEPWGVVLAEAAASGLPLLCTTACGAGTDLVRPYFNGLITQPGDVAELARAMRWMHDHEHELPEMGRRGSRLAEGFSAEAWAVRWHNYLLDAVDAQSRPS